MGLVVPALAAGTTPMAVVQRPKRRWQSLWSSANDKLNLIINGRVAVGGMKVASDAEDLKNTFFFGSTPEELMKPAMRATSFSCSLGAAMLNVLVPALQQLPMRARSDQPLLFACENDHAAVERLQEELKGEPQPSEYRLVVGHHL